MTTRTNNEIAARIALLLERQGVDVTEIRATPETICLGVDHDDDIDPSGIGGGGEKGP